MSNIAWLVLAQLARGAVWDGDVISKQGRTELVNAGLAQRCRRDRRGLAINELTAEGLKLAARLQSEMPQRH